MQGINMLIKKLHEFLIKKLKSMTLTMELEKVQKCLMGKRQIGTLKWHTGLIYG